MRNIDVEKDKILNNCARNFISDSYRPEKYSAFRSTFIS